jgi:hypothetical protein
MQGVAGDAPEPRASFVLQFHILDVFSIGVHKRLASLNVNQEGAQKRHRGTYDLPMPGIQVTRNSLETDGNGERVWGSRSKIGH